MPTQLGSYVAMSKETEKERYDRELIELLNELRVVLPGVQVLFAFLLAVPVSAQFDKVNGFERAIYFFTLTCTAVAAALLIAPSAFHRIDFRNHDKAALVLISNRLAIAGTVFMALAMVGALTFIADLLYGEIATIATASAAFVLFALLWFVLPVHRRITHRDDEHDE
jgi:ethanolamine utilization microcompartment shell protein EutS